MGKHTPGPWSHQLSDEEDFSCQHEIMGAWRGNVRRFIGGAETLEDARLMAAAPDLLAAAKAVMGDTPPAGQPGHIDFGAALALLRDAIAKAEGA